MRIDEYADFHTIFLDKPVFDLCINHVLPTPVILITDHPSSSLNIEVEEGLNADVLEIIMSDEKTLSLNRSVHLKKEATLNYSKLQLLSDDTTLQYHYEPNLDEKSTLTFNCLELGQGDSHQHIITNLKQLGSIFNLNALVNLKHKASNSSEIVTTHYAQHTHSELLFKHILDHDSKATFSALSHVQQSALYSKAFQNCDTTLLSDDALIKAQPHLKIDIDELEASHGTTTGALDEESIFYLKTRGIDEKSAQKMLLQAIETQIYDKISHLELKEKVTAFIGRYYEQRGF